MREITVSKNDSGQRLDRFLIKCFPALTMGNICKLSRKNCIKLNGKKCDTKTHNSIRKVRIYSIDLCIIAGIFNKSVNINLPSALRLGIIMRIIPKSAAHAERMNPDGR